LTHTVVDIISVCLSVPLCVTLVQCIKTAERMKPRRPCDQSKCVLKHYSSAAHTGPCPQFTVASWRQRMPEFSLTALERANNQCVTDSDPRPTWL